MRSLKNYCKFKKNIKIKAILCQEKNNTLYIFLKYLIIYCLKYVFLHNSKITLIMSFKKIISLIKNYKNLKLKSKMMWKSYPRGFYKKKQILKWS